MCVSWFGLWVVNIVSVCVSVCVCYLGSVWMKMDITKQRKDGMNERGIMWGPPINASSLCVWYRAKQNRPSLEFRPDLES